MVIRAGGRLASIVAVSFLAWGAFAVPANAACNTEDCSRSGGTASPQAQEQAGKPVALGKFTKRASHQRAVAAKKYATKRAAKYARTAVRVHKAGQKFSAAQPAKPKAGDEVKADPLAVTGTSIAPSVADARAEMSEAEVRAANLISGQAADRQNEIQLAAADQVNDIDRAASEQSPAKVAAAPSSRQTSLSSGDDSTWDRTSLIGKIFVAFGGLLTLASAARMFIA